MSYTNHIESLAQPLAVLIYNECNHCIKPSDESLTLDLDNIKNPGAELEITARQMAHLTEAEFFAELIEPVAHHLAVFVKEYGMQFVSVPVTPRQTRTFFAGDTQGILHVGISAGHDMRGGMTTLLAELMLVPIVSGG